MAKMDYRTREVRQDNIRADAKTRTVKLSFSSEEPVQRWYGVEVLDHSPGSVDLSRLNNGGAVLLDHDTKRQIGVVEEAWLDHAQRKGRARVRFGNGDLATEIFNDVKDGIRQLVSVGYSIDQLRDEKPAKGPTVSRAIKWTPMEISIVAVPADTTVGVGRSRNMNIQMNEPPTAAAEIEAIAATLKKRGVTGIDELASRSILSGLDVETFRKEAFKLLPAVQPIRAAEPLDVKPKDWARYSVTRALRMQLPGAKRDGLESEIDAEISMKGGARAEGIWIPREAMVMSGRNFVAGTGTLGGMLVQTDNLGSQFVELLRNRAKCAMLGARMINLSNPTTIPRRNAAGAVNWVGETVSATLSNGNFTQITLTPRGLSAFQQFSKQLLSESDPSIDALIRDDIMESIGIEIDRAVLHGAGGTEPVGITGTSGVTTLAIGANGGAFAVANAFSSAVSLETAIATANADNGSLAYMTNAKMRGRLKVLDESAATNTAKWVWRTNESGVQVMNGYRAEVTNQVSSIQTQGTATTICSSVFFGNWQDVLIASFNNGATDVLVDPYTLGANAVVRVIARHWCDVCFRHPQSFAVLLGILDA